MDSRRLFAVALGAVTVLVLAGAVAPVAASPAPVSATSGTLLLGGVAGAVLFALGVGAGVERTRRSLAPARVVGFGVGVAVVAGATADGLPGTERLHELLALGIASLPGAVALGWVDARDGRRDSTAAGRLRVGLAVAVGGLLLAFAPLTALGGTLFFVLPVLVSFVAIVIVIVATPLYLLGVAGGTADRH